MITFAKDSYHSKIKELWRNVFGDSEKFIDLFFANRHNNKNMLLFLEGDSVAAMLTILPFELKTVDAVLPAGYVYAVATDSHFRGQGLSTKLLHYAHEWMKKHGFAASVLVPSSDDLFAFYGKRGYKTFFYVDELTLSREDLFVPPCGAQIRPCAAHELYDVRNRIFDKSAVYARWDKKALEYVVLSSRFFNGDVFYIKTPYGEGCAVCEKNADSVIVKELALDSIDYKTAVSLLAQKLSVRKYFVRLPENEGRVGALTKAFGMIRWFDDELPLKGTAPYLSLILD